MVAREYQEGDRILLETSEKNIHVWFQDVYKRQEYNSVTDRGVDECNLWGDYFYLEAVVRCLKKWNPYW